MDSACRLVVIGGGCAGFSAALEAAETDADVIVLEKMADTGGSSAICGGALAFAGTDLQRNNGIEDSDELLFKDLREVGQFENDEIIVRTYVQNQLATYHWLRKHGVEFSPVVEASAGQSVPRWHAVDPADMVRLLQARCLASGKVRLMTSTRAQRLLRNPSSGRVEAVLAEKDGAQFKVSGSDGIILASGGFSRNPELLHRFAPGFEKAIPLGGEGNVGDGLRMAWQLGADFRDMCYIKGTYGKHPVDTTTVHPLLAVYKGAIAVNQEGKRYVDESLSYKLLGDACMRQTHCSTYQIFDQDIFESGENRIRILDIERRLEMGLLMKAPSLEQLAQMIEVPVATLLETVARYNGFVTSGYDADFGRKCLVHHHGKLRRIERAPFYVYPSAVMLNATYCGLCVDRDMRVLDVFGDPIEGLYAAGEVVGGLHGAAYVTGSALGKAAIFGRLATRTALARSGSAARLARTGV